MKLAYRKLTKDDLPVVSRINTEAFYDYPLFSLPSKELRQGMNYGDYLYKFMYVFIEAFLRHNDGIVCELDGEVAAFALLRNPANRESTVFDSLLCGGFGLVKYIRFKPLLEYCAFVDSTEYATRDILSPHWHLLNIAVSPKMQGKHIGTLFLQDGIIPAIQRKKGTLLSLTTNTAENEAFYLNNHFELIEKKNMFYHGTAITNWSFKRAI